MEEILAHFQEYLIIGLILALFFKESLTDFINAKLGIEKDEEKVPNWGERLIQYANHDTTAKLDKLIAMEEKEHEAADQMRELVKESNIHLREIKEYGVRIRQK